MPLVKEKQKREERIWGSEAGGTARAPISKKKNR